MSSFIDWATLKNPVLAYDNWSIKDACCVWRQGVFTLFFSAFDQERSHVAAVRTTDFNTFSDFLFRFDGRDQGHIGMCSPDVVQVGDTCYLTFNSWGDDPRRPNQLFYMESSNLITWSERRPLAPDLARGARAIDPALAFADGSWVLIFKREQLPTPFIATAPSLDGPWHLVGEGRAALQAAPGGVRDLRHENFQFILIDGRWCLLCTDYVSGGGISHHPYLYTIGGAGQALEDWLSWEQGHRLEIPAEPFNALDRDNAAALRDWRAQDGHFYLVYAGKDKERLVEFSGQAGLRPWPRGWNKLGLARSRDLMRWYPAGILTDDEEKT